jgi:mRNA interferase RelE/StbE
LPEKIAAACVEFIFGPLAENPCRAGAELRGQLAGLRSARRGSYRIIYQVDDERDRVDIVQIDHRGDVYR